MVYSCLDIALNDFVGVLVGGMTWTIRGAGGFFTVDGQSLKYGSSLSTVVGFCMASSRICCPEGHFCGGDHHATCGDGATFLTTQKWSFLSLCILQMTLIFFLQAVGSHLLICNCRVDCISLVRYLVTLVSDRAHSLHFQGTDVSMASTLLAWCPQNI